jgi:alkyl hydroperoxide reductase subunit AhpF
MVSTWDVVVVGAGPADENAAQYAIQGSERTAVIIARVPPKTLG